MAYRLSVTKTIIAVAEMHTARKTLPFLSTFNDHQSNIYASPIGTKPLRVMQAVELIALAIAGLGVVSDETLPDECGKTGTCK